MQVTKNGQFIITVACIIAVIMLSRNELAIAPTPIAHAQQVPDVACIGNSVCQYLDGVMGDSRISSLQHLKFLSPVFNMTSPYFVDIVNTISQCSNYWEQLDGIAGNAYNFLNGPYIPDWVNTARNIPAIGSKPIVLTEIGWYELLQGSDRATALNNLTNSINWLKNPSNGVIGSMLFNVFNNNPGWSDYSMSDTEINTICSGSCDNIGANSAVYYSSSDASFYDPAGSHNMGWTIEIANNDTNPQLPSVMPGINSAHSRNITPVIRIGVMDSSGGFDTPAQYVNFLVTLNDLIAQNHQKDVYVIVGPNEPETECWASQQCFNGCSAGGGEQQASCALDDWPAVGPNVSAQNLVCACSGSTCAPWQPQTFNRPTNQDTGQADGTGQGFYQLFDYDVSLLLEIPPVLPYVSVGTPPGGGPGIPPPGGGGGGTCNPFNCFAPYVVDFATSLECAANSLRVEEPTWYWFDRYGPYCDNETRSLPFGYNFWVNFYDKYAPVGAAQRTCCNSSRNCSESPPGNPPRPQDVGMACPAQSDPLRQPGAEEFDYYRGALDTCGLTLAQQRWTTQNTLGLSIPELADHMYSLNMTYLGLSFNNVPRADVEAVLTKAQENNINPWLLMGMWATESAWSQTQSCQGGGGSVNGCLSCPVGFNNPGWDHCKVVTDPLYSGGTHFGQDFLGPQGSPVYATTGGIVETAGYIAGQGVGYMIRIAGNDGNAHVYFHLNLNVNDYVIAGDTVTAGQQIAEIGPVCLPSAVPGCDPKPTSTCASGCGNGLTNATHLHYEIYPPPNLSKPANCSLEPDPIDLLPPSCGGTCTGTGGGTPGGPGEGGSPPPPGTYGTGVGCSTTGYHPTGGSATNRFHWDGHRPVDLFAVDGAPAYAPYDGVSYPVDDLTGGYTIEFVPSDRCQPAMYYAHNRNSNRVSGNVTRGQQVGFVSNSGSACQPCTSQNCTTGEPGCSQPGRCRPGDTNCNLCNGSNGGRCYCNASANGQCSGPPHIHLAASTNGSFTTPGPNICAVQLLSDWGANVTQGPEIMCCNPDLPNLSGCQPALNQSTWTPPIL